MSDKSFRTTVVGILVIQLLFVYSIYSTVDSLHGRKGTVSVYLENPNATCGIKERKPCYVKVIR